VFEGRALNLGSSFRAPGADDQQGARPAHRYFDQPRLRNLPPPPDRADYPVIDDFEIVPVVTPVGVAMRWQRRSGEPLVLFLWGCVEDARPPLDSTHAPVGTMREPWVHLDQGWYFMALEDDGEVIVEVGDDISNVTGRFRVPAAAFHAAWALGYDRTLDVQSGAMGREAGEAPAGDRPSFRATAIVVIAFAIAMGWLEAVVVVYLRAAIEAGVVEPALDPATFGTFEAVEIARELATLVMIAAVGWLAGRSALERLGWAAVVFGVWDLVYYAGLWLAIGWPPAIDTWDLLFLVPAPWVGPVWAPVGVSVALVACGLAAVWRLRRGLVVEVRPVEAAAALAGGVLVVVSLLVDAERVIAGDTAPWTGWPIWLAGMALASIAAIRALSARR
jgi:hypothetical protein